MVPPDGLDALDPGECLRLLGQVGVGRVGLSVRAMPVVVPVVFALLTDALVVSNGVDKSFQAACDRAIVAFQTDGRDDETDTEWCVLVQGRASLVDPATDVAADSWLSLPPWGESVPGGTAVRIGLDVVTGQRVTGLHPR